MRVPGAHPRTHRQPPAGVTARREELSCRWGPGLHSLSCLLSLNLLCLPFFVSLSAFFSDFSFLVYLASPSLYVLLCFLCLLLFLSLLPLSLSYSLSLSHIHHLPFPPLPSHHLVERIHNMQGVYSHMVFGFLRGPLRGGGGERGTELREGKGAQKKRMGQKPSRHAHPPRPLPDSLTQTRQVLILRPLDTP